MTGQMQYLKRSVPKINDIAFIYISGQWRGGYGKCLAVKVGVPARADKVDFCPSALEKNRVAPALGKSLGFEPVAKPAIKFMQAAAMIEMRMRGDGL